MFERRHLQIKLNLNEVRNCVEPYINGSITTARLISSGLSNTNYHIIASNNTQYIFRIHHDKKTAIKEYKLNQNLCKLTKKIPLTLHQLDDTIHHHTCSIIEFLPGKLLSDISFSTNLIPIYKELANFIADINQYQFNTPGQLDKQLKPKPFLTQETSHHPYVNFMLDCLNGSNVKNNIPSVLINDIKNFVIRHEHLTTCITNISPHLVHGDFKPENILVKSNTNNQLQLSGIIDWEYARSDYIYADIATLFRNYIPKKNDGILTAFANELSYRDISLVSDWFILTKYIDFINLLAFLDSKLPRKNLYQSIIATLKNSMTYIENC